MLPFPVLVGEQSVPYYWPDSLGSFSFLPPIGQQSFLAGSPRFCYMLWSWRNKATRHRIIDQFLYMYSRNKLHFCFSQLITRPLHSIFDCPLAAVFFILAGSPQELYGMIFASLIQSKVTV